MKYEEIKINEIYEVEGFDYQVIHKHEESRVTFTLEVGSNTPYGWAEDELHLFKPIALPETGLLVSKSESIVYRTGERSGYGFNPGGCWYDNNMWKKFTPENWRKATPEDEEKFKKLLIQEAAKRGFVDGVEFKSDVGLRIKSIINTKLLFFDFGGFTMGGGYVFHDGKWATPIKNKKQDELDRTIEKLFKLAEELGIEVLLTLDNKEK